VGFFKAVSQTSSYCYSMGPANFNQFEYLSIRSSLVAMIHQQQYPALRNGNNQRKVSFASGLVATETLNRNSDCYRTQVDSRDHSDPSLSNRVNAQRELLRATWRYQSAAGGRSNSAGRARSNEDVLSTVVLDKRNCGACKCRQFDSLTG
jgi:hypothetical protein